MLRCLQLACIFMVLTNYKVSALLKAYAEGGSTSSTSAGGLTASQSGSTIYCGSLTCSGAVNCILTRYGSDVSAKCTDSNLNVIDEKSYKSSGGSEDVELYFGPAYKEQADAYAREMAEKGMRAANERVQNVMRDIHSRYPFLKDGPHISRATPKNVMSYLSILCLFLSIAQLN